jgi:prepilin-type N-terminal cleavage/methylation domain-containing protein/prepilin-type processing-associated H-X9-DG protein
VSRSPDFLPRHDPAVNPTVGALRRTRGFSLVELLVVIAILGVLLALVASAIAPVRQAARVTADLANLRQLAIASTNYATDHRGRLVDAQLPHGTAPLDEASSFVNTLSPYTDSPLALRSPIDGSRHWREDGEPIPGSTDRYRATSYGLNNHLCREFSPWGAIDPARITDRISLVAAPTNTVQFLLMAETGEFAGADHVHVEEWGGLGQAPAVASSQASTAAAGGVAGTPTARSNYAFLDGHVATHAFGELYLDATRNRFDPNQSAVFDLLAAAPEMP